MKVLKKILNTLVTILIIVVLVVSIFVAIFALTSKASGISTIFGNTIQIIQSDSMKGGYQGSEGFTGGNFEKGDVIIGKPTDFVNDGKYEAGDIVTYKGLLKGAEDMGEQLICHRIINVYAPNNGEAKYQTKGDNDAVAEIPDQDSPMNGITASSIGAVFHTKDFDGTVIKGLGNFMSFLTSQMGFFLVVLLPMIAFFLYELVRVVLNVSGYKKAKQEDIKEEMRKEFEQKYGQGQVAYQGVNNQQVYQQPVQQQYYQQPVDSNAQQYYQQPVDPNTQQYYQQQPVQNVVPQQNNVQAEQTQPTMTPEEYQQWQQFQEFKKMQEMYNQQNNQNNNNQ